MCGDGGGGPGVTGDTVNAFNSMDSANSALNAARGDFQSSGLDAAQGLPMGDPNVSVGVDRPMNWGFSLPSAVTGGKAGSVLGLPAALAGFLGGGLYGGTNQGDMSLAFDRGANPEDPGVDFAGMDGLGLSGGPGDAEGGGNAPPGAAPGEGGGPAVASGPEFSAGKYYNRFSGEQLTPEQFMSKLNASKFMR